MAAFTKEVNSVSERSEGQAWESRKSWIRSIRASLARAFGKRGSSGSTDLGSAEEKRTETNRVGVARVECLEILVDPPGRERRSLSKETEKE